MPNSYMDLWSQIYILDFGETLGEKITYYRNSYFYAVKDGDYYDWRLVPGMDKIIDRRIAPLALRLDADKYLDLPGLTSHDIKVKLPHKVEKEYKSMAQKLYAEINGKTVYAESATEKYHICRDMLSGAKYVQRGSKEYTVIHNEKLNALEEFIGEMQGKPVMVAYERWHEHDRIQARFGGRLPAVNGKTSTEAMSRIQRDWNACKIPILLVQPAALSHGLNLQRGGHDLVWFCGAIENYEFYEQLQRRLYRQGVQRPVRVHHIVVPGSLDMVVLARLRSKRLRQMRVFDAIKAYRDNQSSFSS
jgi:SNF2 family DNA or RNA helicase